MRVFYRFIIFTFIFFFFSQTFFAVAAAAPSADCVLSAFLKIGSRGEEVKCLQGKVGTATDGIFGPLTKAAVQTFQSNHNLAADGLVGPLSRAALNNLAAKNKAAAVPALPASPASPPLSAPIAVPDTNATIGNRKPESLKNPQKNLEKYVASIKKSLTERGESSDTVSLVEETIRTNAKGNPNALQEFFNTQIEIYKKTISGNILKTPLTFLQKAVASIDEIFSVKKARASLGRAPFGGFIVFVDPFICTCDLRVGQLFVELPGTPPPISNMILNYVEGSQAFLNYNLPEEDTASVGFYAPGVLSCLFRIHKKACIPLPAAGQITPVVGTSLE